MNPFSFLPHIKDKNENSRNIINREIIDKNIDKNSTEINMKKKENIANRT